MSDTKRYISSPLLNNKRLRFLSGCLVLVIFGVGLITYAEFNSSHDILSELIQSRNDEAPKRTPDVFAENFSDTASKGQIEYLGDDSFKFIYQKSTNFEHSFSGVFFPLENIDVDFSEYDNLVVRIITEKARRIPVNLAFDTKLETHQYIRDFIEVKEGQTEYRLKPDEFFTPEWWYDYNKVSQVEIPDMDLSKVEALSFESCHLLAKGIEDQFVVESIVLEKNTVAFNSLILTCAVLLMVGWYIYVFEFFKKKKEVVHIPVKQVEFEEEGTIEDDVLLYLGKNYVNPNLTLSVLSKEFGKSSSDISKMIKAKSGKTFPQYLSFLRINEAKRILLTKDFKTVAEVGYTVGFNSSSNFIRVFKSQEGQSPKSFAEENAS